MNDSDGSLPAALDELHAATARLIDERKQQIDGAVYKAPSLYDALVQDIPASTGSGASLMSSYHRATAPAWIDALDLRHQIDGRITEWHRAARLETRQTGATNRQRLLSAPELLRHYTSQSFRPQDSRMLTEQATELDSYCIAITNLLEPAHVKTISAPCPSCNRQYVMRQHAGEWVRQAALQIVAAEGCSCRACGATWKPEHYVLLCRVLGFDLPEGITDE